MKPHLSPRNYPARHHKIGFTLVELMMGVGMFLAVVVGVMVGLQVFGLRVYTLSATKLTATADARKSLNMLRWQIRSAKVVQVGNYTNGLFSRIADGRPQTGNALEVYFNGTNNEPNQIPVVYYQDPGSAELYSSSNGMAQLLASYVTNQHVFTAEDYQANTLTSYDNNPVIRVTLKFYQWQYPIGFIGTNALNAYNHYRLQTRISRRLKE